MCLGGLITDPGRRSFSSARPIVTKESSRRRFSLGFVTLPTVFARMPAGQFFGASGFFMLFLAAITSSLSACSSRPSPSWRKDSSWAGDARLTFLGFITAVGSAASSSIFSKDLMAMDTLDFSRAMYILMVLILIFKFSAGFR